MMALNCFSKGRFHDGWKWWKKHLILFVLIEHALFLPLCLAIIRGSSEKPKTSDFLNDKVRSFHKNFNVYQNQVQTLPLLFKKSDKEESFECIEQQPFSISPKNGFTCSLKVVCSEREAIVSHDGLAESIEEKDQCLVRDDYTPKMSSQQQPFSEDEDLASGFSEATISSLPNDWICGKNLSYTKANETFKEDNCISRATYWITLVLGFLVGVMLGFKVPYFVKALWVNQKQRSSQKEKQSQRSPPPKHISLYSVRGTGKLRKKLLVLYMVCGTIGSFWLYWNMNNNVMLLRKEMLANMCDERARMLQDQFNVSMNHVHSLAVLVSTFHHGKDPSALDQQTFAQYTERTAFERPLTSGVAYAKRVLHSEREMFEKEQGWTIKKMHTEDPSRVQDYLPEKPDAAPIQDEYAPVILCQETVSHLVSIDMMSGKEDRENILRARATGKGVLTSPFPLLKSNHLGVVLTFAVYDTSLPANATPEQRIAATEGYLGASYDVPSLVEKLLHQLASKQTIVVNVYDTTDSSEPINMYGPDVTDTGLFHVSSLDFGDPTRKHEMHCRFKQKAPPSWTALFASLGTLIILSLIGHIFHAAINRIAKVEDDYQEILELKVRAEAADVAKSQFLATVSHEIRTPMNGVLGMLQMLMNTDLSDTQHDYAQTAYSSGRDLIALINEVLDQAKIESGKLELEAVQFDLRTVLDNVLSLFAGKSHDKGIELAVYVSDSVPQVLCGDPGRFRQIVTNLVGNSIKFTEEGHIFISVHLADEVKNKMEVGDKMLKQQLKLVQEEVEASYTTLSGFPVVDRWKSWENFKNFSNGSSSDENKTIRLIVSVEDTGIGIPEGSQGRIFMPYMQGGSSTSRTHGGTGIGLSISKCLVDMMEGEIGFVSEVGRGSTFTFSATCTEGQTQSLTTNETQSESSISQYRGLKVLVIDGKSIRAQVTSYYLQRLGISVEIAVSLEVARSITSDVSDSSNKTGFDMVLIEEDSFSKATALVSCHLLKEHFRFTSLKASRPKIILLASSSSELYKYKSTGCVDDIFLKPLRLSMMATSFQQALGSGSKRHELKRKPSNLQTLLRGKRILVVDDNIVNRRVAAGALKKYGAEVICVESGKAAVQKLQPPHNFDACFMDLQMPVMDGFEATRHIRNLESKINEQIELGEASNETVGNVTHWHTPILAMTADVILSTQEKCMKCGMDDYVSKPFEEEQLYTAVVRFFKSD